MATKRYMLTTLALAAMAAASAQTFNNLVIEATDGEKSVFNTADIAGVMFSDMPEYREADQLLSAFYSSADGLGVYTIDLCTGLPDNDGNPAEIGDSKVTIALVASPSEDYINAILPAGYYTQGVGKAFTFAPSQSAAWTRYEDGEDGVAIAPIIYGSVDVRHEGSAYDIRMELVTLNGEVLNLSYEGEIQFTPGNSEYESFDAPVDAALTGLQGRFYGNWYYPFADDILVQGYSGEFDENDAQVTGYWLNLPLYMPKVADPMNPVQTLADGVYSIEKRSNPTGNTYLPFTFQKGTVIDFMGIPYSAGTYLTLKEANGAIKMAYIVEGTVTVSDNGTKMTLDGLDEYGTSIKVSFSGNPLIVNFCDNDEKEIKHPWSTLTGDYELNFTPDTYGVYFLDEPSIVEGLNTYTLWLTDASMTKGDYLQFTILSDEEGLPDGTYTVATTFQANTILPGWTGYSGTDLGGSWFADLESANEEGEQQTLAPIYGGTITISTDDIVRTITIDLTDDNNNKITGTYSGLVIDGDGEYPTSKPAKLKVRN